ncbi:MAG: hypothetical protein V1685_06015 [Parcubacteria group bacterium]
MITTIQSAISSLSAAKILLEGIIKIRDFNAHASDLAQINKSLIEAQELIRTMQERESALSDKIKALETENIRLKDWTAERQIYQRKEIASGIFAYVNNSVMDNFEHAHKLCENCFNKTIKSPLQQSREPNRMIGLVCPNGCPKVVFTHYKPS